MLLVIIIALIFFIISWVIEQDAFIAIFPGIIGAMAGLLITFTVASACPVGPPELISTEEIVSLSNRTEIEGHYYLGHGTVNSTDYFHYLGNVKDRGYKWNRIPASMTYINEIEDGSNPRIEHYKLYYKWEILDVLLGPFWFNDYYSAYIPEDSIVENFVVRIN